MLDVKNLKRSYGDFVAVNAVNFSIAKGEIVGLLGHNGAGKTTMMKMLSGYLEPSAGSIVFNGMELSSNLKQLQQKIGYLPENLPVYSEMYVADYLDYSAELKGLNTQQKKAEVKRVIRATDIAEKLLSPIATLSRGFKQRVGVAQALLGEPQLLILDEPTNGLDPTQTQHMRELIRDLARNATVILSTHIMQEVDALCDRVLLMRSGQLVVDAKLADLRSSHFIMLTTSGKQELVKKELLSVQGVTSVEPINTQDLQWRIKIDEQTQPNLLSARIAKHLINTGIDIYQLKTETRDLETLFRNVSEQEVIGHAA